MAKQQPRKPETLMEKIADKVDHVLHPSEHQAKEDLESANADADEEKDNADVDDDSDEFAKDNAEIEKYSHPKFAKFKNNIEGIK